MHKRFAQVPVYITLVIIVAAALLAGCGSTATSSTPASTPTGSSQPAQYRGKGGPGGQDFQAMQAKLLARVAEILGVSNDSLTTAYQSAMKEVMGSMTPPPLPNQGQPPSGDNPGTPPMPPMPPSDNRTGGPGGPGGRGGPDMSGVYSKVASALGLTAEKVQAAFEQARTELMPERQGK